MNADTPNLKALYDSLERYSGWLDRERASALVRADVKALGVAINTQADPLPLLHTLEANLARLPSGELRKMLRAASKSMRRALDDQAV